MSEAISPADDSGKADIADVAEEAWDALAEREGIDDNGDVIPDEDEPLLEADDDSEEYEDDDPIEASDDDPEPVAETEEPAQADSGETLPPPYMACRLEGSLQQSAG